jgi:peptidoglycan hydrolase-like protein with peptidoglycan-binding domain
MAEASTQKSPASGVDPGRPDISSTGTRSKEVLDIQQRLLTAGFDPGPPDGIFGPRTADAVRRFQEAVGLRPDGRFGPETALQLALYLDLRDPARPLPDPHLKLSPISGTAKTSLAMPPMPGPWAPLSRTMKPCRR